MLPRQEGGLRATSTVICPRLGNRGPIAGLAADRASSQLPADRGRGATYRPCYLADPVARGPTTADLLPLRERQPRKRSTCTGGCVGHHAASLADPPPRHRLRHTCQSGRVLEHLPL